MVELLRQRLRAFAALLSDSRHGAVYGSWLHLLSPDAIVAVAGQPVIRDWGMLPNAVPASAEARESHSRGGIGQYLLPLPVPPFGAFEAQAFATAMGRHGEREAARVAPLPGLAQSPVAVPVIVPGRPWLAPGDRGRSRGRRSRRPRLRPGAALPLSRGRTEPGRDPGPAPD